MTATWIVRLEPPAGGGLRVAVKDAIDVVGIPTTVASRAVAKTATPAEADAACLAGLRAAGAVVVGKTNLHELCFGTTGVNPWTGTPVNPAAPDRVPGGSSSGSAVAVAVGEADVGLGTDTGGSVRIPAACCGVVGLKTTWGRISLDGVWPLAPRLDTVGPLARDVPGVVVGMQLLEPGFEPAEDAARRVGRVRLPDVHPDIDAAIDAALASAGFDVEDVELAGWESARQPFRDLLLAGAWDSDRHLLPTGKVDPAVAEAIAAGEAINAERVASALAGQQAWQAELAVVFHRFELLALPTLDGPPPLLADAATARLNRTTAPFNLAGLPAISIPVPSRRLPVPPSLQLVGPAHTEALLCRSALAVEAAIG